MNVTDGESITDRFQRQHLLVQVIIVIIMAGGPVFCAGWGTNEWIGRTTELPAEVRALKDSVIQEDLNGRMDAVESEVDMLQQSQREARKDMRSMKNTLDRIQNGVDRIECLIENPQSPCLQRGRDSSD